MEDAGWSSGGSGRRSEGSEAETREQAGPEASRPSFILRLPGGVMPGLSAANKLVKPVGE